MKLKDRVRVKAPPKGKYLVNEGVIVQGSQIGKFWRVKFDGTPNQWQWFSESRLEVTKHYGGDT